MKIRLLCIGRQAQDPLLQAADSYVDRLNHYAPTSLVRLREGTMASEAADLLKRVTADEWVIALDEHGAHLTTVDWTRQVLQWRDAGRRKLTFVVGGATGLHPTVKERAQTLLALSHLTLPHRLAQVVLLEQLYRVQTILRGEHYHRA